MAVFLLLCKIKVESTDQVGINESFIMIMLEVIP